MSDSEDFNRFLKPDVSSYSGPEDIDRSEFMSALYDIDPSLQGKAAAENASREAEDLIETTLRIAVGKERAVQHRTKKNRSEGAAGIRPTAVIQELRQDYDPDGDESENEGQASSDEDQPNGDDGQLSSNDWDWEKGYVYNPDQDSYVFDLNCYPGPFVVSGDRLRRMARRYSKHHGDEMWHLDEVAAAEGMAEDAWREIKNALGITHRSPGHLREDFEQADLEDIENWAENDVQLKKHKWKQVNEEKTRRELEKAAQKWFDLDGTLEAVRDRVEDRAYEAPKLSVRVLSGRESLEPAALVLNAQDFHLGQRPVDGMDAKEYIDELVDGVKTVVERAGRAASVEKIYLVVGGDLLNVDNAAGETTAGTPQDQLLSTRDLLVETEIFLRTLVDICRQVAETELVAVSGNHDEVLSQAVHQMAMAYFDGAEGVVGERNYRQRQHRTWRDHYLCFTHGDYTRKIVKRLPQICMREARDLLSHTHHATIHSGHDHQEEVRFEKAGWLHHTAPAPVELDDWHEGQAYAGGRRALQATLHFEGGDDMIVNHVLGRRT